MCPTQLATQCVANWKCQVKLPHILHIGIIKAFPKFLCQTLRQLFNQILPVFCLCLPLLLFLHNDPTDVPVCLNHSKIHSTIGAGSCSLKNLPDTAIY